MLAERGGLTSILPNFTGPIAVAKTGAWTMTRTTASFLGSLIFATLLTGFYLETAVVFSEGEMSEELVVKPWPGTGWSFGGGEDGAWERAHPGEPTPWWLSEHQSAIVYGSPETTGSEWWVTPYFVGLLLTPLAWLSTVILLTLMLLRRAPITEREDSEQEQVAIFE